MYIYIYIYTYIHIIYIYIERERDIYARAGYIDSPPGSLEPQRLNRQPARLVGARAAISTALSAADRSVHSVTFATLVLCGLVAAIIVAADSARVCCASNYAGSRERPGEKSGRTCGRLRSLFVLDAIYEEHMFVIGRTCSLC